MNIFINHQSLNLMEGRGVGGIHRIGTEYSSRTNHADRRLMGLHVSCLHRGCLGTKQNVGIDVEGILFISSRMSLRNIQLLKVVAVILYLRSLYHLIAHADKDLLHLFQG